MSPLGLRVPGAPIEPAQPPPCPSPSQIPAAGEQHLSACPPVRLSTCPYSRGALGKEARQGRSTRSPPTCLPPGAASREQHRVPGPPTGTPRSALWGPVSWEDPAQPRPPQSGSPWVLQGGDRWPGALPGVSQLQSTRGGSADPQLLGRESGGSGREPAAPRPPPHGPAWVSPCGHGDRTEGWESPEHLSELSEQLGVQRAGLSQDLGAASHPAHCGRLGQPLGPAQTCSGRRRPSRSSLALPAADPEAWEKLRKQEAGPRVT